MNIRTLFVSLFVMASVVILDTSWAYFLEQHERQKAREMLSLIKTCVYDQKEGELADKIAVCAYDKKTTPTGDVFAYNLITRKYVYESSVDFEVEGEPVISESGMCQIHSRPDLCIAGLKTIDLGYDSSPTTRLSWQFDDSTEFLEWIIFPSEYRGIHGKLRGSLVQPEQVAIVIGIQEDELKAGFHLYSLIIKLLGGLGLFLTVLFDIRLRK